MSLSEIIGSSIGQLIAKTFAEVGKQGVVTIEEAPSFKTDMHVVKGWQFNKGYISPYFVNDLSKMTCELENAFVLIYEGKISSFKPIIELVSYLNHHKKQLLIIADDVDSEALSALVINKLQNGLKVAAVKCPSFGADRREVLTDIATLCNTKVFSSDEGMHLENIKIDMLGQAKRIIITQDETTIIEGIGQKEAIEERCTYLKSQIEKSEDELKTAFYQSRLARLTGGIAVIRVGGATEIEMKERKDRVEDAMHATRAALQEGIMPGGGVALIRSIKALEGLIGENTDQNAGIRIVRDSLSVPCRQILLNAGNQEGSVIIGKIQDSQEFNFGYDAQKGEFCNLIEKGIIDPTKVVRTALEDAASVGGLFITTEAVLTEETEILVDAVPKNSNSFKIRP